MARPLVQFDIKQPGVFGLSTQEGDDTTDPRYALQLDNFVYNENGQLASRKELRRKITADLTGKILMHEYIDDSANSLIIYYNDTYLLKESGTGGTADISGATTERDWKFVNFNGWCCGHHPSYAPIELTTVGGTFAAAGGTQYNGTDVLASNGRLWIIDGNTLRYSDLLINSFAGGSSGSFDLAKYWPNGMDEGIALAEWNDRLIVFGKRSIIIYENPDDPTTSMAIEDTITGIGCIARDTVTPVGKELYFLSESGLRSIGRTIQEKSSPIGDISSNIHNRLMEFIKNYLASATPSSSGCYSQNESIFLLTFGGNYCFAFDTSMPMEGGALRVSKWTIPIYSAIATREEGLLANAYQGTFGDNYSIICTYGESDYYGDQIGASSSWVFYDSVYKSPWLDFGEDAESREKVFKTVTAIMSSDSVTGAGNDFKLEWFIDFKDSDTPNSVTKAINLSDNLNKIRYPVSGSGAAIQIRLTITPTQAFSGVELKRIRIAAKLGRLS